MERFRVGGGADRPSLDGLTLAMRWNGSTWTQTSTPSPGGRDNVLAVVDGASSSDVWAVGYLRNPPYGSKIRLPLILHWNGAAWSQVPAPMVGTTQTVVSDVVSVAANDAWAVGHADNRALVLRWNGTSWRSVAAPPISNLGSVIAFSPTNVWTVGSGDDGLPRFANWRGSGWTVEPAPSAAPRIPTVSRLAALAPGMVWAVGTTYTGTATPQPAPVAWRTGTAG